MDIRKISDTIYKGSDRVKKEKMDEVYYKMSDFLKDYNKEWYDKFYEEAESIIYYIDEDCARKIVGAMLPYGQRWSMEEVTEYLRGKGIMEHTKCYYLVMNMMYNDYARTAKQYNIDVPEFYFDLSYDFINDPDAKKHKVEKYFME